MQLRSIIFLIFLLAPFIDLAAQKLQFRQIKPNIANAPKNISKILQDKSGFIWLGTERGLLQYDGITFTPFYPEKLQAVTALFQDDSNKIWQGFKDGKISYFKNGKNHDFSPEEGLPKIAINAILQDKEQRIWFATYGEGVYYFYKNRLYNINTDDGLTDNFTYDLAMDDEGNILVATDRGISKIHISNGKKMLQNFTQSSHRLPDNLVTALEYSNGQLWFGTQSGGHGFLAVKTGKISFAEGWNSGQVNNMNYLPVLKYLIGTQRDGLMQIDPQNNNIKNQYSRNDLFGIAKITDQIIDKEGNLWLAGGTDFICMAPTEIQFLNLEKFNEISSIRAIEKLGENYWLGTQNGVFIYNSKTENLQQFELLKSANITSILKVGNAFWFGTLGDGIYIYDLAKKWLKHYTEKDGLVNNNILSISLGKEKIYVATLGGASIISNNKDALSFRNLNRENGFPADYIYQIYEDENGNTWFCTDGRGLIKFNRKKYIVYKEENGLNARTIISITPALKNSTFYVASADEGLFYFDGNKFDKVAIGKDIGNNNLRSVFNDNNGNLIVTHANGITVFDPQKNMVKSYSTTFGLQNSDPELNAWTIEKSEDYKGDFIIAMGKKLVLYFNTKTNLNSVSRPQTRIKNISLFLDSIPAGKTDFSHSENHISFDFIGLWYHNPEEVTYQIKLEGYDPDWVNTRNHFITYPNLRPGKYAFQVRSSAGENFTNASIATYTFEISAPFWKRAWFYIPLILLIAAGGYFYIRQREKMLKNEANIARQNIEFQYETLKSQVNPHFLFNSFNTLAGIIETNQQLAVEYVEQLSDFFRNLLIYKDKSVITLAEELTLLENYFFLQKKRYGENLQMEITVDEKYRRYKVPPLCLQLLIENAIKHNIISREKPLHIKVETKGEKIIVRNHFQAKANMEKSAGIGLSNIKSRYSLLMDKEIKITSTSEIFEVELPLLEA